MEKGTSSWASSGSSYEVFLSFRGLDTRHGFTDYLYHGMVDAGILIYRDEESLPVGKRIGPELLQAIKQSKIYIPIFSKNYASSHWCLRELAYMIKCVFESNEEKEILPIFLDVEPEDVKLKTDLYSQALLKHQRRFSTEVESWRKALIEVDEIKGWNCKKDQGQGILIQTVIRTVSIKLKIAYENVPEHLVGVDDHVEAIIKELDVGSNGVKFLGICGIGGIGKTTLAKIIFNKLFSSFDKYCFLADVRERSLCNGLVHLQKQLLSEMVGSHSIDQIHYVNDGINMMNRGVLRDKKVLVVLDDVDEQEQLKSLANEGVWFGSSSRIIITTRDQNVLSIVGVATSEGPTKKVAKVSLYEVSEMKFDYALNLFSRHAFRRDSPPNNYLSISKKIVSTLGKLPLALEITGSSLKGKPKAVWEDTLKSLKRAPPKKVQKTLMITYEKLDHQERQVFLDIACFFVNQDIESPLYMWDDCGYCPRKTIDDLFLMSLIKIKDDNTFWMHDQVRDLGRTIVCQENSDDPCKRSRAWNLEEVRSILKQKERNRKIQALSIHNPGFLDEPFILELDQPAYLPNLRFFEAIGVSLAGDFNNLFSGVRWLSCQWPSKFEARNFDPTNLVVLNLSRSDISVETIGWIREARKLKLLDLSHCKHLTRTPNLSTVVSLERLILHSCHNLDEIDKSIGKLELLKALELDCCESLRELPEEVGCLQSLTKISLPKHLRELPKTFGNLKSLLILDFSRGQINKLPHSIGEMAKLRVLKFRGCNMINELPDSIGNLQSLIELDLSWTNIGHLPDSIGDLTQLKTLEMRGMEGITYLPTAIWRLKKLEELNAADMSNLTGEISEEIGRLCCLRILELSRTRISGLPPTMSRLSNLRELGLYSCEVVQLPELPPSLTLLRWCCNNAERFPRSPLETLTLAFQNVRFPLQLPSCLRELTLANLAIAESPDFSKLKDLSELRFHRCSMPEFSGIYDAGLEQLFMVNCTFRRLDALFQLEMKRLTKLVLIECEFLPEVIDLSHMKNLDLVCLCKCNFLVEIRGFEELGFLSSLSVCNCGSMERMSDLSKLRKLRCLSVRNCPNLRRVEGVNHLESLKKLRIYDCETLLSLGDTSHLGLECSQIVCCERLPNYPNYCKTTGYCDCKSTVELRQGWRDIPLATWSFVGLGRRRFHDPLSCGC